MSSYYHQIQSPTDLGRYSQHPSNFHTYMTGGGSRSASRWGRDALFACRVVCRPERSKLEILKEVMPSREDIHAIPALDNLVLGPDSDVMTEPDVVVTWRQRFHHVGNVWPSLTPFIIQSRAHGQASTQANDGSVSDPSGPNSNLGPIETPPLPGTSKRPAHLDVRASCLSPRTRARGASRSCGRAYSAHLHGRARRL